MRPKLWSVLLLCYVPAFGAAVRSDVAQATAADIVRAAAAFDRSFLTAAQGAQRIRQAGALDGGAGECCVGGWVDYDIEIAAAGWYELSVAGSGSNVEYAINPDRPTRSYQFDSSGNVQGGLDKVGNFWLDQGRNSVRVQRFYWTGFPHLTAIALTRSGADLRKSMRAAFSSPSPVFRRGECEPLSVSAGPAAAVAWMEVRDSAGALVRRSDIAIPRATGRSTVAAPVPCDREGSYLVTFGDRVHGPFEWRDVRGVNYEVIDTATPAPRLPSEKIIVQDIDLTAAPPDYEDGGRSQVVRTRAGAYRESGATGFTRFERAPDFARRALPSPSWFAYRLRGLEAQQTYTVEIEYPDDAARTMMFALREASPLAYPVSSAVDTGGEFQQSGQMKVHRILFWPRSSDVRLVVMNVHDTQKAAAARVRVYRAGAALNPAPASAGRAFVHWYEEGMNFLSSFGTPDQTRYEWRNLPSRIGIERWLQAARASGFTAIMPTAVVYSFAAYPSRFNQAFSNPDSDDLRRILLYAEKHGLQVIPELHPRADELSWPYLEVPDPKPNLLLSAQGRTTWFQADGRTRNVPPLFDAMNASNQSWYVEMIGELADRYRDSPALAGISLRSMSWANPALNNLGGLAWGYDAATIDAFSQETGLGIPASLRGAEAAGTTSPELANARRNWLLTNARADWLGWRCQKVAALYERIVQRVRHARPDLLVYTSIFSWTDAGDDLEALREAGIDPRLLAKVDGLVLVNALGTYGRREPDALANQVRRDRLLDPRLQRSLINADGTAALLTSASYIEATDAVVPPALLGFAPTTRATWASAAGVPAGLHALERFAVQLAETDALMLGDGGNGYALPQPALADWLNEYRALPALQFQRAPGSGDPAAVWSRPQPDALWFYAVNRERYPVRLSVQISGTDRVTHVSTGQAAAVQAGALTLDLQPYQLAVFKAPASAKLSGVSQQVPAREMQRLGLQAAWLEALVKKLQASGSSRLDPLQMRTLDESVKALQEALRQGHPWRARMSIEHHRLRALYDKVGAPPGLLDASSAATPEDEGWCSVDGTGTSCAGAAQASALR